MTWDEYEKELMRGFRAADEWSLQIGKEMADEIEDLVRVSTAGNNVVNYNDDGKSRHSNETVGLKNVNGNVDGEIWLKCLEEAILIKTGVKVVH